VIAGGAMRWKLIAILWFVSTSALAQEGMLRAEFRREHERFADACKSFNRQSVMECVTGLFTDHPLHIATGSMPPQNGFGLGMAFVASKNTETWRMSWDVDAVGSTNRSWRAGGYMKLVHTPMATIHVVPGSSGAGGPPDQAKKSEVRVHPYTVVNLYAQTISLNKLNYFGLGNDSTLAGASVFGMRETIVGANAIKPVFEFPAISNLNLSLFGEVNGRFVNVRSATGQSVPSIETVYNDATAPGLTHQPGYFQLGEGVRIKPVIGDRFELNYSGRFQEFFAPSNSDNSFLRWTVDLNHTFYLYGYTETAAKNTDANGPDSCAAPSKPCPRVSTSRNLNGSFGVRFLMSESITSGTSTVPFYFQQSLGGQDLNSSLSLSSYQDYRFRAPSLLLLQENFEHSIWGPFGFKFMADQGRVAENRGDLGFSQLKHSFAAGLTLRAGGFPMVSMMFAWGGAEGHHNLFNMNNSLLGGSARPTLD
jgi:hypothetical protein